MDADARYSVATSDRPVENMFSLTNHESAATGTTEQQRRQDALDRLRQNRHLSSDASKRCCVPRMD